MSIGTLSPAPKFYAWNTITGEPLAGGLLYTVTAGGAYPGDAIATYTDVGLSVANSNPVVLNSAGYCVIYLTPGTSYKYILYSSVDNLGVTNSVLQWTQDNIVGPPVSSGATDATGTAGENIATEDACYVSAGDGGKNAGQWYRASASHAYSSSEAGTVGLALTALATGSSGSFRTSGQMPITGSSLNPGSKYYVGSGAGTLTTSSSLANSRYIGEADGVNSINIAANPPQGEALNFIQIQAFC